MPLRATTIKTGAVRGIPCGNPLFTVYKGIPYAAPVSGANRFRPPQPREPWQGELLCNEFPERAMQKEALAETPFGGFFHKEFYPYDWKRGEDCLKLNVWTPAQSAEERLPVMFWIHGGGLGGGYGHEMEFDGEALCKEGVILVTINYRLNYFGFFAHPELSKESADGVSGNYGMLDQIAALRWVQENIKAFGGDPGNVTIFGQSAGGGSVVSHLCSPVTDGLFAKAIIQSGAFGVMSYASRTTLQDAEAWGVKACEYLGKTVEELREMPMEELFDAFEKAEKVIGPAPKQNMDGKLYPMAPGRALLEGKIKDVPIMVGSVKGDTDLGFLPVQDERLNEVRKEEKALLGDSLIACKQEEEGRIPAYVFYFDTFIPGGDEFHFVEDGLAYHSAELWYVFGTLSRCWRDFDGRHYELSRKMIKYWTNFAKTGDPNGEGLPQWDAVTGETEKRMYLNEDNLHMQELAYMGLLRESYLK